MTLATGTSRDPSGRTVLRPGGAQSAIRFAPWAVFVLIVSLAAVLRWAHGDESWNIETVWRSPVLGPYQYVFLDGFYPVGDLYFLALNLLVDRDTPLHSLIWLRLAAAASCIALGVISWAVVRRAGFNTLPALIICLAVVAAMLLRLGGPSSRQETLIAPLAGVVLLSAMSWRVGGRQSWRLLAAAGTAAIALLLHPMALGLVLFLAILILSQVRRLSRQDWLAVIASAGLGAALLVIGTLYNKDVSSISAQLGLQSKVYTFDWELDRYLRAGRRWVLFPSLLVILAAALLSERHATLPRALRRTVLLFIGAIAMGLALNPGKWPEYFLPLAPAIALGATHLYEIARRDLAGGRRITRGLGVAALLFAAGHAVLPPFSDILRFPLTVPGGFWRGTPFGIALGHWLDPTAPMHPQGQEQIVSIIGNETVEMFPEAFPFLNHVNWTRYDSTRTAAFVYWPERPPNDRGLYRRDRWNETFTEWPPHHLVEVARARSGTAYELVLYRTVLEAPPDANGPLLQGDP